MKNYWKIIGLLATSSLLTACGNKLETLPQADHQQILGLASPIKLGIDTTTIILADYVLNPNEIDSVQIPKGLSISYQTKDTVQLVGSTSEIISTFKIFSGQVTYTIPTFKSEKQKYNFQVADTDHLYNTVVLMGSMNGWATNKDSLTFNNGTWSKELILTPGDYQYKLHIDGKEVNDPTNENLVDNGFGAMNNVFTVSGAEGEAPILTGLTSDNNKPFTLLCKNGTPLIFWNNFLLDERFIAKKGDTLSVTVPKNAVTQNRSYIRVFSYNQSAKSEDLLIPLHKGQVVRNTRELTRKDQQNMIMYFLMLDRFKDGDQNNNRPLNMDSVAPLADFMGGDIQGLNQVLESGYFDSLGVNTVWSSPINKNPEGAWGLWNQGGVVSRFSGYHGYWPMSNTQIDDRFGNDSVFEQYIDNAHSRDKNVLIDYVANHVHETNPVIKQHPTWKTDLYLPDGRMNTELWDEERLTTWFDTFLPTLDLENPVVADAMSDSALIWFKNFEIDGFRHDATKHIPNEFWRTLTSKMKRQIMAPDNRSVYQIGETYGNPELIGSYINSGMLDAQFDFNLYDATITSFGKDSVDFTNLANTLQSSIDTYGAHHVLGNITGNQDRPRFMSLADGSVSFEEDAKLAGWTRDIEPIGDLGYKKLVMLNAFNLMVPGVPVIYYGDEYGMPGGNDPDNRRMMQFSDLNPHQEEVLDQVKSLISLRKTHMALLYGETYITNVDVDQMAFIRNYFDETVIATFNNSALPKEVIIEVPGYINIKDLKSDNGQFSVNGRTISVTVPAYSFNVLYN